MKLLYGSARILDIDIENRPLSYWFSGQCTPEVTAIAAGFIGGHVTCRYLQARDTVSDKAVREASAAMLAWFTGLYNAADIVTGHYIRRHDLPVINGALVELGMPVLCPKLTIDTKLDLRRFTLPKSQEALSAMIEQWDRKGKSTPRKEHMTQADWRRANRLTGEGILETIRRVRGDVRQHQDLFAELSRKGYLRPAITWHP